MLHLERRRRHEYACRRETVGKPIVTSRVRPASLSIECSIRFVKSACALLVMTAAR
jgi:hypothetical protein